MFKLKKFYYNIRYRNRFMFGLKLKIGMKYRFKVSLRFKLVFETRFDV